jgi:zinc protease
MSASQRNCGSADRVFFGHLLANELHGMQRADAECDLLGKILGGGKSSRLYKKLVYEKQIAQDVG